MVRMARFLAEAVMTLHFAVLAFLLVGGFVAWRWRGVIYAHLAIGAWAVLSLLVSRAEAFGMVVTESLARGIPVIVREGTGAVEALRLGAPGTDDDGGPLPGAKVAFPADDDPANPALLAQVLRSWLEDTATRASWRERAVQARSTLPGWDRTAAVVLDAIRS